MTIVVGVAPGPRRRRPRSRPNILKRSYDAFLYVEEAVSSRSSGVRCENAALHGIEVPEQSAARMLEIGCGDSGYLTPTADALPVGTPIKNGG
jgi:hypothetical protein